MLGIRRAPRTRARIASELRGLDGHDHALGLWIPGEPLRVARLKALNHFTSSAFHEWHPRALPFLLKAISEARAASTIAIGGTVMGAVWIGGGLAFLVLLRELPDHGRLATITVLLAVWAGDTFAYFGGRLIGRHKLAPTTSPGKTWEGLAVGTLATVFVAFVALYHQHFLTIGESIVLGFAIAIAAPLGDLFESLLKRDMDVKDTGTLLGGHGGMLDRIDALLFAAPAAYFTILAFH